MCGIGGIFRFDDSSPDLSTIEHMKQAMARRGPDAEGTWTDGAVALGHRRLSVIDLSDKASQPMHDPASGLVLVFNGAIYNYPELRQELIDAGHTFVSHGDTEVILKAYVAWGEACVERLHGMFAFAIHDTRRQTVFMARDRMGIKPLYYSLDRNRLVFASSTQAVLCDPDVDRSIDPEGLNYLLTLHAVVPAPHTVIKGVRKLEPGHTMTINARGDVQQQQYWSLNAMRPERALSEWEWAEAIRESLMKAVHKRKIIADVPVGVLLSGGLDSSLLVALLKETGVEDLLTFSVGFEDSPEEKGHEFEFSDQVVERYRTTHHKIQISNEHVLERLPEVIDAMAEPIFGQDAIGFYLLAEQVSRHVKVVQSGQGADEVFAGYFWYPQMHEAKGDVLDRFAPYYFDRDHTEYRETIMSAYVERDYSADTIRSLLTRPGADEFLDQVLRMDVTMLVVDDPVKRVDNMTMAWGLEARVPFLDHELVELAAQIPPALKLKSNGKHILKMIARGLIPDAVIDRPKGYFPVPALKYVRGDMLEFMRGILHSDACRQRGLFRTGYIEKLLAKPEEYLTPIKGSKLGQLAMLEYWLQRHVDGSGRGNTV